MKLKLMSLFLLLLIGTYCFSEDIFLNGGFSASPAAQLTAFDGRTMKVQPALTAGAFLRINFSNYFYTGLAAGLNYTFSSDINGGWRYPGFNGPEASFFLGMMIPGLSRFGAEAAFTAGWYRYTLTDSMFFLPSATLSPSFILFSDKIASYSVELPVKYFFHNQADLFMSAGLRFRMVFK